MPRVSRDLIDFGDLVWTLYASSKPAIAMAYAMLGPQASASAGREPASAHNPLEAGYDEPSCRWLRRERIA